jgi:ureidoacrylate peracid hydrolase
MPGGNIAMAYFTPHLLPELEFDTDNPYPCKWGEKETEGMARERIVSVWAKPEPLRIDTSRTATLVVDMQNDFGAFGGMFDRAGIDIRIIRRAIAPTASVLTAARAAGIPILYIKMEHQPDLSDLGPSDGPHAIRTAFLSVGKKVSAPNGSQGQILVRGTWNTEILSELHPAPEDIVISKHRYSAFYETGLDAALRELGIKYLVVTGCTTSVCVESTIRDAMFRDYSCLLLKDCTAEPVGNDLPRSNHEASLLVIEKLFGWVSTSHHLIEALGI